MVYQIDDKLTKYFEMHKEFICCEAGCSSCCEKGDYPLSELELRYVMQGYAELENSVKIRVQENIKNMVKGKACPFLVDKLCSIYPYRPIVCRVHGLAYLLKDGRVKLPYCVNDGKNYAEVYSNGVFLAEPIKENLETAALLNGGEIRNLYDWVKG